MQNITILAAAEIELFKLEKTCKITKSNHRPDLLNCTTTPCP